MDKLVRVSDEIHKIMRLVAKRENRTLKAVLELAIEKYSKRREP